MSDQFEWQSLQNGSDIRGVAVEGVENEAPNLTAARVRAIASSFVSWLHEKNCAQGEAKVSVGMDPRISGPLLKAAAIEGLLEAGARVGDAKLASTPAMFMSTVLDGHAYHGAIMITASHLPFHRNGLKFFTRLGGLENHDITELLERAACADYIGRKSGGEVREIPLMRDYAGFLVDRIRQNVGCTNNDAWPLRGFKIVVDAANGSGGFFVRDVLDRLGADTTGSLYLNPDGKFPNHVPNPEDPQAMKVIRQAVLANGADLGVDFDPDVDRASAVGASGELINRNRLIGLMAAIVLEEHPRSIIVTDSVTSDGLQRFIEQRLGGRHHRFKRGYKNVINEAKRLNAEGQEAHLAIETSGHCALKENYFLDDGAYLVIKLLTKMAQLRETGGPSLVDLIQALPEPAESCEFRLKINRAPFKQYGNLIIRDLAEFAATTDGWSVVPRNYEGIRVSCDKEHGDGWFLLRLSLHDPVLPLNVESERINGIGPILTRLAEFFDRYPGLVVTPLTDYLSR